ncbi:hypothetical protein BAY61_09380 [Prauserella marina]|uniref:Uncharacterized protein n=1 Tax=Prauserella marina TaxID=530584 RepID=A0A222VML1_9PSEU|nr:hypothetical protein [Prauserella marina]ASR35159.1 hypothetical protein BAY61_09380 [Prauserella marina]PWV85078.1 hypothetical protein DES30_1011099 [Prauserella marina]SDC05292.1 hypothetical protein SAMN05421630_101239 [Prauserella marina]
MSATAFSAALRGAISTSGLGLDRIQARLQERGISISVTALSYWQSGKRQPERQSSISAVRVLEEILDVPAGALLGLLPPPRPRGASSRRRLDEPAESGGVIAAFGFEEDASPALVGLHDLCDVDAEGRCVMVTAKAVLRAGTSGHDRWVLRYRRAEPHSRPPTLRASRNCTVGRTSFDSCEGLLLAELLFGHGLDNGETQLVEYSLSFEDTDSAAHQHFREFSSPVPEYLVEARFAGNTRPERSWQFSHPETGQPETRPLRVDNGNTVHAVAVDFGPGRFGIGWSRPG